MHHGRVFDLHGHTEFRTEEPLGSLDVAFPWRIFPNPLASVVLDLSLCFAITGESRRHPFDHLVVYPWNRDSEVSLAIGGVLNPFTSNLRRDRNVGVNAPEARPCFGIR